MPVTPMPNGRFMPSCDVPNCGWQPRWGSRSHINAARYLSSHRSETHRRDLRAIEEAARDAVKAWRTSPTDAATIEAVAHLETVLGGPA